jgi:hypothetical protein
MNINESPIFLHVGYPKCASTFLQKKIFSPHPDIDYIGPETGVNRNFNELFFNTTESLYDPEAVRNCFLKNGKTKLLSIETLVGDGFTSHINGDFYARRLSETFPNAKIIIIVRNQENAIESLVMQWIKSGWSGKFSPNDFFKQIKLYTEQVGFDYDLFKYTRTINYYRRLFGSNNVHVLFFEDFQKDIFGFVHNLLRTMNVAPMNRFDHKPLKRKITPLGYFFMRLINRYRTGKFNFYGGWADSIPWLFLIRCRNVSDWIYRQIPVFPQDKSWINNSQIKMIREYYRGDNQKLAIMLSRDLKIYDYPVLKEKK